MFIVHGEFGSIDVHLFDIGILLTVSSGKV